MQWAQDSRLDPRPFRVPIALRVGAQAVVVAITGLLTAACVEERVVYSSWSTLEEMADESRPMDPPDGERRKPRTRDRQWAVLITSLDGPGHHLAAADLVTRLRREGRLTDVWARELDQQTMIYKGSYGDPTHRTALNAQRQVRMIKIGGQRPFSDAQLVPVVGGGNVAASPFDLRQYTDHYSLQIEVYDGDVEAHRDVAEQRAQTLRDDGNSTFYYHGPHRSMVTVGLFTRDEAFVLEGQTDVYAPVVRDLQRRHPRNLHNGHVVIEKKNGRAVREQSSFLVYIR